ncbi:MAG: hypothetical protein M3178_09720 [Pseudomonadota bacterium]|nr:hypothetical protein [Pseudomonadota bacterium]
MKHTIGELRICFRDCLRSNVRLFMFMASMLTSASCFAASIPHVIVTSLTYNSAAGFFTSVLKNQGAASTPTGVTVGVSYSVDGVKRSWGFTNTPLVPGASASIGSDGRAYVIPNGTHTITAVADDVNRFPESNENNNALSQSITGGSVPVPPPVSANGATITGAGALYDSGGNTWTLSGGVVYENGQKAGATANVAELAYVNGLIYQQNSAGGWWDWVNNTWSGTTSPLAPSGTGQLVTIASLTAHNTSAYSNYDQSHFPTNFGTTSYVSQTQTVTIDSAKMDRSMNPLTPGHVSRMDVHSLIPKRPELRWFAHLMPWYGASDQPIAIGLDVDTDAYVKALVTDLRNRGFNGVIIAWNGITSRSNSIALRIQSYLKTLPPGSFSYIILMDEGLVDGQTNKQSILENAVNYTKTQYFGDSNYEKEGGQPILMFFGVRNSLGSAAAMAAAKADTGGNMVWAESSANFLNEAWEDQGFDWTNDYPNGVNAADPYNLSAVKNFLSIVAGYPQKKAFGAMTSGLNGTLTKSISWSLGKYFPRDSGAALIQRAQTINANIPGNVTRMQWVTWNDYPEGSAVEPGIENDVTVTAGVQGSTLNWTYTSGTGDESTIDHYEVYASTANINAAYLGSVPAGIHSFPLGSSGLTSGTFYHIIIVAVGKPCIRDHVNNNVSFTAP